MDNFYELEARYDSRNSFYGKALVKVLDNGDLELHSYYTKVAKYSPKTAKAVIYGGYNYDNLTYTTLRHIREFLKQNRMPIGSKKELIKMYCKD